MDRPDRPRALPIALAVGVMLAMLVVCGTVALALWVAAHPPLAGLFSDSINYLQIAEYFSASFSGTAGDAHRYQFASTRFPPLYSLLLAMTGAGLQQWNQAITVAAVLVAGYAALCWVYLRQQTGSAALALVLVPVAVLTPYLAEWLVLPLSEPLYAIIVLAALLLASTKSNPVLAAAALVSLAPLCRSAGLALVLAYVAWLATNRDIAPARRALGSIVAVLPAACWAGFRSTQPVLGNYTDFLSIEATLQAAGGFAAFVAQQAAAIADAATSWLDPALPGIARAAALVLAIPTVVGLLLRARDRRLDAWYVLVYLGIVAIWPYPVETPRLLSVVAPLLMLSAWTGSRFAIERFARGALRAEARPVAALALSAIAVTGSLGGYQRLLERTTNEVPEEFEPARRWTHYLNTPDSVAAHDLAETLIRTAYLIDEAAASVPHGACVYTHFRALVDMRSAGALRTVETPQSISVDTAADAMSACDYVLVTQLASPQRGEPPLYPLPLLGARANVLLASEGERGPQGVLFAALVRIERGPVSAPR